MTGIDVGGGEFDTGPDEIFETVKVLNINIQCLFNSDQDMRIADRDQRKPDNLDLTLTLIPTNNGLINEQF